MPRLARDDLDSEQPPSTLNDEEVSTEKPDNREGSDTLKPEPSPRAHTGNDSLANTGRQQSQGPPLPANKEDMQRMFTIFMTFMQNAQNAQAPNSASALSLQRFERRRTQKLQSRTPIISMAKEKKREVHSLMDTFEAETRYTISDGTSGV